MSACMHARGTAQTCLWDAHLRWHCLQRPFACCAIWTWQVVCWTSLRASSGSAALLIMPCASSCRIINRTGQTDGRVRCVSVSVLQ